MLLAFGIACALLEARARARARSSTRRWSTARRCSSTMFHGMLAAGQLERSSAAPTCSTPARPATTPTRRRRQVRGDRRDRAEVLRRAARAPRARPRRTCRRSTTARAGRSCSERFADDVRGEDARRVVRGLRGHRRLLRAGADAGRGARAIRTTRRARRLRRARGVDQPAPAPRFSRTAGAIAGAPPERGEGGREALADWGFERPRIERLDIARPRLSLKGEQCSDV